MLSFLKKILIFTLPLILLSINFLLYSNEEISKKYFNNIFGGGKEKIIVSKGNKDSINIYYAIVRINLFDNYSG